MNPIRTIALALSLGIAPSFAAQISAFTPQGEVSVIDSVKVSFDSAMVDFGNEQAPAPMELSCNDDQVTGHGRWIDSRQWTYVFMQNPGPGVRCTATLRPSVRTLDNQSVSGRVSFDFSTGGPVVQDTRPYGATIDEDQVFVLQFNGAVDPDTLVANTQCLVEDLGEVVPVRLITGDARLAVMKAAYYENIPHPDYVQLVQCKRRLPALAHVQLSVGPGVTTPSSLRPPVASSKATILEYTVRSPFKATFSCQRENAKAPCTPVAAVSLEFSAPITRADAMKIRLKTPTQELAPSIKPDATDDAGIIRLQFDAPFAELSTLVLSLPDALKDDSGRELSNADQFPLAFKTADFPPLVKFAAAPFGIIERFANVPPDGLESEHPASVPVSVRNVEAALPTHDLMRSAGRVSDYVSQDDLDVLRWYARVQRLEQTHWTANQIKDVMADKPPRQENKPSVDARSFSALKGQAGVRELILPGFNAENPRPFELIGVPVPAPGFHVLEIESARLGKSLLAGEKPMYVRTAALVTNLGVHIKTGRDDMLAWVTTLDDGKVVPDAAITVMNCSGRVLASGKTNDQGVWHYLQAVDADDYCEDTGLSGLYVSARIDADHPLARHHADFSFAFSDWQRGIESWRFNVSTDRSVRPTELVHTVFDRTLFRAGETVSMKHFIRVQTRHGLAVPRDVKTLPVTVLIQHQGSDERYEQPLSWNKTPSGGLSAQGSFKIPESARLGMYSVTLSDRDGTSYGSDEFRVEEFKLPLLTGKLKITAEDGSVTLVAPKVLTADVQVSYVSGGAAGQLPISLSGVTQERWLSFPGYEDYSFNPPASAAQEEASGDADTVASNSISQDHAGQTLFLNKKTLTLDAQGGGRLNIDMPAAITRPADLLFEASFADPNGQIQTLAHTVPVWPASVVAGLRAGNWLTAGKSADIQGLALTPAGRPQSGVQMSVSAIAQTVYSSRKRLVGGFYSYDNHTVTRDLGTVCRGKTDTDGLLACSIVLTQTGSIQLVASIQDDQGNVAQAASTVWVAGADELWFGGDNDDRIDVIPTKKVWKPGETAQFQVRMPFRQATALVAVEREGVISTQVVTLKGKNPMVSLVVQPDWGPNVYVSVLALRGRLRELPWYSFFTWGWQQPKAWYGAFSAAGKEYAAPTPFVDLSRPTFRFGLAQINVSDTQDQLVVKVESDKKIYQVRDKALVTIQVTTPDGKPAAHGSVAFAAVDQALLELAPNNSWDLLDAMRQYHSYGVETATAQTQIVGRRHYGRKALPAGGGGGKSPTRELLDTLLLWNPTVQLDEQGKAQLTVPLNDAITRFQLVAVADFGEQRFGTGSVDIVSTQDVQVISGFPALVREGDTYQAMITVRNATQRDMHLEVSASFSGKGVSGQTLTLKVITVMAGAAGTVSWTLQAPASDLLEDTTTLDWVLQTAEQASGTQGDRTDGSHVVSSASNPAGPASAGSLTASDRLVFRQILRSAVPVTVQQATLVALGAENPAFSLPVAAPASAIKGVDGQPRGGLQVSLRSSLAGGLPAVKKWFETYPYTCLEQLSSKAIGLRSATQWQEIMHRLPSYLDDDGLAGYFPGARQGNEVLTAYLLMASDEAQALGLPFIIPDQARQLMTNGLLGFVQGKLVRERWAPVQDLDVRKLMVLEALSRQGLVQPRMLDSIAIDPDRWPTAAVIDWMAVLQRVAGVPNRNALLEKAYQALQARLLVRGTTMAFGDDARENWWWLMSGPDVNLAKLMLITMDQPRWRQDMPRLAQGLLSIQHKGAWRTTTANLLGSLAIEKFSTHYETTPVSGQVSVSLDGGGKTQTFDWRQAEEENGVRSQTFFEAWTKTGSDTLKIDADGRGTSWATIRALAAVPVVKPVVAGYELERSVTAVSQATAGVWSRGDVYRVRLQIRAKTAASWAVLSDPVPAGAMILGSGLGRDSSISTLGEAEIQSYYPSFVERGFDTYRAYYEYLPAGLTTLEYTVRLNTAGQFQLPATRIETLYQPDVYGELPNIGGINIRGQEP